MQIEPRVFLAATFSFPSRIGLTGRAEEREFLQHFSSAWEVVAQPIGKGCALFLPASFPELSALPERLERETNCI